MSSAAKHLSSDPVMAGLIKQYGEIEIKTRQNLFEDIVSSIISQQLSTKAASTIEKRFVELFGHFPNPEELVKMDPEKIRVCGISYSKIKYIQGLAQAVIDKQIDLESLPNLTDEEVILELVKLKGIGKWTAEMLLMFSLGREDIFSMGDLGLRSAIGKLYGIDRDNLSEIEKIVKKWSPYKTYASRYLWMSLDNSPKTLEIL